MSRRVRENRLFLGNPGTGKSTLINCMVGQRVFRSGTNWGSGLTKEYQRYIHDDVVYMDTPGLADQRIIQQAAEAITTALNEPGTYKLFFMVRLQYGRVVSEDLATIERVLDSIDLPSISFSILINNLGKKQYETLLRRGTELTQVLALMNSGRYSTSSVFFIPTLAELDEADDQITQLPRETVEFIEGSAPSIFIPRGAVTDIDLNGFEQQTKVLKDLLEELQRDQVKMMELLVEQQKRFDEQMKHERKRHEDELESERRQHLHNLENARDVRIDINDPETVPPYGQAFASPVHFEPSTGYVSEPASDNSKSTEEFVQVCLGMTVCCFFFGPFGICFYLICCND
jgi:GTP-binding protein EngB required for normal cell division